MNSYRGLITWSLNRHKFYIPLFIVIQIIIAFAITYGFAFITNASEGIEKSFLYTGGIVINIITVTCVLAPQIVNEAKQNGIFEYQKTLPLARLGILLADVTTWVIIALPGIIVSIIISSLQADMAITVDFFAMSSMLLAVFALTFVGFSIAYMLPSNVVALITQVIMLGGLLFSPIVYSADRLPAWAEWIYNALPFVPVSNIIRASLFSLQNVMLYDYIVVCCWGTVGFIVSMYVLMRRK